MYTLEFENVTNSYGRETVVDDLTFTLQPGRLTGFLGPNGAGKATAMRSCSTSPSPKGRQFRYDHHAPTRPRRDSQGHHHQAPPGRP